MYEVSVCVLGGRDWQVLRDVIREGGGKSGHQRRPYP